MPMIGGTLARYFGLRFLRAVLLVFAGIFALVALIDYIEMMRRSSDLPNLSAILVAKTSFYRVPQVTEQFLAFCVLIGTMSCYETDSWVIRNRHFGSHPKHICSACRLTGCAQIGRATCRRASHRLPLIPHF